MAAYATRAVKSGRRLCGQEKSKDVLSPLAQARCGFTVSPFPKPARSATTLTTKHFTTTPRPRFPIRSASASIFPAWLATRTERDRRIIGELMLGERTLDVSQKYQVSPARISQLRREYLEDWSTFCDADTAVMS